jgi:ParB family chromosome partitioning protein
MTSVVTVRADVDPSVGLAPEPPTRETETLAEAHSPLSPAAHPAQIADQMQIRPGEKIVEIPLSLLARNSYQTRATSSDDPSLNELAESIKAHGVIQPVVVRPKLQPGPNGEFYELIAGERRWLASARAGRTHIPAVVRDVPNQQVLVLTIIENLHRQDLNPIQHARALERLSDEFRLTQEEVAARTGISRSAVANYLRLVRLPLSLQDAVADGRLGFGQAKVIMSLGDTRERDLLARKVITSKLTVRETEALLHDFLQPQARKPASRAALDPNVRAAETELQRALGCRVQIRDANGKGKIVIEYKSLEDFDRILEALK